MACSVLVHAAGAVIVWRTSPRKTISPPEATFVEVEVASPAEAPRAVVPPASAPGSGGSHGSTLGQGGSTRGTQSRAVASTGVAAPTHPRAPDLRFEHEVDIPVTEAPHAAKRGLFQRPLALSVPLMGEVPPLPEKPRKLAANPGGSTYDDPAERFSARVSRDGTVELRDQNIRGEGLGFGFDVNDLVDKALGRETYLPEKRRLLEESFEQRAILASSAHRDRLQAALAELPARLSALWSDPHRPAAARRRLLFELWDEIDATDPASAPARAVIERFIRAHLPAGSADAYSPSELSNLNAGRAIRFCPY